MNIPTFFTRDSVKEMTHLCASRVPDPLSLIPVPLILLELDFELSGAPNTLTYQPSIYLSLIHRGFFIGPRRSPIKSLILVLHLFSNAYRTFEMGNTGPHTNFSAFNENS